MKKTLKEKLLDFLIQQLREDPQPEREIVQPPVVELALKSLKMKKRIQEYDKELVGEKVE